MVWSEPLAIQAACVVMKGYLTCYRVLNNPSSRPLNGMSAMSSVPATTRIPKQIAQESHLPGVTAELPQGHDHVPELAKGLLQAHSFLEFKSFFKKLCACVCVCVGTNM